MANLISKLSKWPTKGQRALAAQACLQLLAAASRRSHPFSMQNPKLLSPCT